MGITTEKNIVTIFPIEELVNSYKEALSQQGYTLTPNLEIKEVYIMDLL